MGLVDQKSSNCSYSIQQTRQDSTSLRNYFVSNLAYRIKVRDFAAALEATLGERDSVGKTYELGGPNVYTMEDFINNCIFEYTRNDYSRLVELPYPLSM
jgi:hypothetical protein